MEPLSDHEEAIHLSLLVNTGLPRYAPYGRFLAMTCNSKTSCHAPNLAFAALLMAGLDGIQNKIHPGPAADKNLYDLPPEEEALIPTVAHSLEMALDALEADNEFLLKGGVFTKEMLSAYVELKREEVRRLNTTTHPVEFEMYYSC